MVSRCTDDASRSARSSFVERGSEPASTFEILLALRHSDQTKNSHPKTETARAVAVIPPNGELPQDIIRSGRAIKRSAQRIMV